MITLDEYLGKYRGGDLCIREHAYDFGVEKKGIRLVSFSVADRTVYAFVGIPECGPDEKLPAVVLVHGGGGVAYHEWAELWMKRGFAAIAPDFAAHRPVNEERRGEDFDGAGPSMFGFDIAEPHPWPYFSQLEIERAHDAICALAPVDRARTALVGISWGGWLAFDAAGSGLFSAAVVVYSSTKMTECDFGPFHGYGKDKLVGDDRLTYERYIEPYHRLDRIGIPVLMAAGADDHAFTMRNRLLTTAAMKNARVFFSYREHFPHGHYEGWEGGESVTFVERVLLGPGPYEVTASAETGKLRFSCSVPYEDAKLVFTKGDLFSEYAPAWESRQASCGEAALTGEERAAFVELTIDGKKFGSDVVILKGKFPENI